MPEQGSWSQYPATGELELVFWSLYAGARVLELMRWSWHAGASAVCWRCYVGASLRKLAHCNCLISDQVQRRADGVGMGLPRVGMG